MNDTPRTLIFVPTYNERDNAPRMAHELLGLPVDADVLFVDDNSPDGTGELLDQIAATQPRLRVLHRTGKLGIGSAHIHGIAWAYDQGYQRLVTMDCDFTHMPSDIPRLLEHAGQYPVVVGSRYMQKDSLPGWNLLRRTLTNMGHIATRRLLGLTQDATGAFRVYDLTKVPRDLFAQVMSRSYAFFFESLFLLHRNGLAIHEVPIVLPARTYGNSKMAARDAIRSALRIVELYVQLRANPRQFHVCRPFTEFNPELTDPQNWNAYWDEKRLPSHVLYDILAMLYRNAIIRRQLRAAVRRRFAPGSDLLHAGCGSGLADADLQEDYRITAMDISPAAIRLYRRNNPRAYALRHADLFDLPFEDGQFDGVYNLGVMEHFTPEQITEILRQLHRVLRPEGQLLLFWPHRFATSAAVLDLTHFVLNRVLGKQVQLHPPEIARLRGRKAAEQLLADAGFTLMDYRFGPSDGWVQAVLTARKT
ncbi:MAG: glycosyltransferase [Phycisphaeraceae bacterium]|nr:glycosyltransferase [Phycisphaeraceae bacterium]